MATYDEERLYIHGDLIIIEENMIKQCWNVDLMTLVTEIANSSWVTDKACQGFTSWLPPAHFELV